MLCGKEDNDVIHAQELNRKGRSDSDQLLFTIKRERCLFTFNVKDFVILHNEQVKAQLLTYLKLSGLKLGLILNFNVPVMRDGIVRMVNGLDE